MENPGKNRRLAGLLGGEVIGIRSVTGIFNFDSFQTVGVEG